jgi:hypothetical protein
MARTEPDTLSGRSESKTTISSHAREASSLASADETAASSSSFVFVWFSGEKVNRASSCLTAGSVSPEPLAPLALCDRSGELARGVLSNVEGGVRHGMVEHSPQALYSSVLGCQREKETNCVSTGPRRTAARPRVAGDRQLPLMKL